jgi:hypothetical protein
MFADMAKSKEFKNSDAIIETAILQYRGHTSTIHAFDNNTQASLLGKPQVFLAEVCLTTHVSEQWAASSTCQ